MKGLARTKQLYILLQWASYGLMSEQVNSGLLNLFRIVRISLERNKKSVPSKLRTSEFKSQRIKVICGNSE